MTLLDLWRSVCIKFDRTILGLFSGSLSQFEITSDPPVDNPSSPDAPVETQSRFWMGPLVAGCCFALGYGITERVLTMEFKDQEPVPEAFTPLAFPGDSLQEIRARFSDDDSSLQVDVTALEAAKPASQPIKQESKETPKPDVALQTPESPVWTAPGWSDPKIIAPELQEDDGSAPSSAQEPEPEIDQSNVDPLMLPEESVEVMPAVVVPGGDSPVLVAEPKPVVLPPGAEAFFEAIEPVTPPQP